MTRSILLAALGTLAACAPSSNQASPQAGNAEPPVVGQTSVPDAPKAATVDPNAPPKPGEIKTFKDWTVACDNLLDCTMASLGPETGDFPRITIAAIRASGPAGGWRLSLDARDDNAGPARIAIDGKRIGGPVGGKIEGARATAIIAAMANGAALDIRDAKGATIETVSLAGAAAALRYIDAAQGRVGTVTASVAKGDKPAGAVTAAPDIPMIAAIAPGGAVAKLSTAQIADMRRQGQCESDSFAGGQAPDSYALGGGKTLLLVPCGAGAYNLSSAMFIVSGGAIVPARTDAPSGFGGDDAGGVAEVVNATFDHGVLTSYAKGRGLGDCGVEQQFVWDGDRFRLSRQSEMGECRGNPNYMTTWQAHVLRR